MPTEVKGATNLREALKQYEPDLAKETTKELGFLLKPIAAKARGYMPSQSPLSGWAERTDGKGKFPTYNPTIAKRGITYKTSPSRPNYRGWRSLVSLLNKSAAGAIYETAGRKNPNGQEWVGPKAGGASKGVSRSNNPSAGQQFIANLGALTKSDKGDGRLIYRAWAENQGVGLGIAMKAISDAKAKLYERNQRAPFQKAA